eukprot:1168613-Prymnesium_polylepis.1
MKKLDTEWTKNVFTKDNAGPWLILLITVSFQILNALVPYDDLPPLLQQAIPLILGRQYAPPSQ